MSFLNPQTLNRKKTSWGVAAMCTELSWAREVESAVRVAPSYYAGPSCGRPKHWKTVFWEGGPVEGRKHTQNLATLGLGFRV